MEDNLKMIDAILAEEGKITESYKEHKRERERIKADISKERRREGSKSLQIDTCP